jgi:hypothetical protein
MAAGMIIEVTIQRVTPSDSQVSTPLLGVFDQGFVAGSPPFPEYRLQALRSGNGPFRKELQDSGSVQSPVMCSVFLERHQGVRNAKAYQVMHGAERGTQRRTKDKMGEMGNLHVFPLFWLFVYLISEAGGALKHRWPALPREPVVSSDI